MRFTWRKANFWESGDICNMSMINCRVQMDFCRRFHAGRKWYKYCEKWRSLLFYCLSSSGNPGAVSWARRNDAAKVFKHWRKSPWVPTLTGPFGNSQANTGSWLGTKTALYYCAQSANRFSWVRTRWLLSCHSCAVYSPSFPNQTKELPMSRKMFWMLSAWARENSVSDGSQCVVNNRKFKMRQRRTRNQKKT